MFNTAKDIALFIVALIAIITGISKGFIFFRKKWIASRSKRDKFFTGSWSNEGNIIKNKPTHFVDLTIYCGKRKLLGSFNIRKSDDTDGWVKVSMNGSRRSYSAKCAVIFIINEDVIKSGKVKLNKNKDQKLEWKLIKGDSDFFPETVLLYRSLPVIA